MLGLVVRGDEKGLDAALDGRPVEVLAIAILRAVVGRDDENLNTPIDKGTLDRDLERGAVNELAEGDAVEFVTVELVEDVHGLAGVAVEPLAGSSGEVEGRPGDVGAVVGAENACCLASTGGPVEPEAAGEKVALGCNSGEEGGDVADVAKRGRGELLEELGDRRPGIGLDGLGESNKVGTLAGLGGGAKGELSSGDSSIQLVDVEERLGPVGDGFKMGTGLGEGGEGGEVRLGGLETNRVSELDDELDVEVGLGGALDLASNERYGTGLVCSAGWVDKSLDSVDKRRAEFRCIVDVVMRSSVTAVSNVTGEDGGEGSDIGPMTPTHAKNKLSPCDLVWEVDPPPNRFGLQGPNRAANNGDVLKSAQRWGGNTNPPPETATPRFVRGATNAKTRREPSLVHVDCAPKP